MKYYRIIKELPGYKYGDIIDLDSMYGICFSSKKLLEQGFVEESSKVRSVYNKMYKIICNLMKEGHKSDNWDKIYKILEDNIKED